MEQFFIHLGRKLGNTWNKGRWIYQSLLGSDEEAIRAESLIGRELAAKVREENPIAEESPLQPFLKTVGDRLKDRLKNKQWKFQYDILQVPQVNAFALPGGFLFITSGLLRRVDNNPDELAFILAHEMMHVVLKHPIKRIVAEFSSSVISRFLVKGGAPGSLAGQVLTGLLKGSYSKSNEREADVYAVRLMIRAGFDPDAARTFLEKLPEGEDADLPIYKYFLSHPPKTERIKTVDIVLSIKEP